MLHKYYKSIMFKTMILLTTCGALVSFSGIKGTDVFEIFINNQRVLQQFASRTDVKTVVLDKSSYNDKIKVIYNHCGAVGKSRSITVKNADNKILKEWKFADSESMNAGMVLNAKDIISLQKKDEDKLTLIYSSKELQKGRILASIVLGNETKQIGKLK